VFETSFGADLLLQVRVLDGEASVVLVELFEKTRELLMASAAWSANSCIASNSSVSMGCPEIV